MTTFTRIRHERVTEYEPKVIDCNCEAIELALEKDFGSFKFTRKSWSELIPSGPTSEAWADRENWTYANRLSIRLSDGGQWTIEYEVDL